MKEEIEEVIKLLKKKASGDIKGDEALKLSQAALNLAHVVQVLEQTDKG
jgi:hypothetical protein